MEVPWFLSRQSILQGELDQFWEQKKTLRPDSLVKALFTEEVLSALRRELHRKSEVRLELTDVAGSLRRLLNPEVLTEGIKIRKAKKRRKKAASTGEQVEGEDRDVKDTGEEEASRPSVDILEHAPSADKASPSVKPGEPALPASQKDS